MAWEVDWTYPGNTGEKVWARNPTSHVRSAREWHLTTTGRLRQAGIKTPVYRKDSWEVDWSKRNGKKVWARNPSSKMPIARDWHWIDHKTLDVAGVTWQHYRGTARGRWVNSRGYVELSPSGMTQEEVELADAHNLWLGKKRTRCLEHRLVAVKKYGTLPPGSVVRHINGKKTDNRLANLVLGTTQENTMDHNTARIAAMVWREKYEELLAKLS